MYIPFKGFVIGPVFSSSLNILVTGIKAAYARETAAVLRVDRQLLIRGEPDSRARLVLQVLLTVRSRLHATFAVIHIRFHRTIIAYKNR